MNSLTRLLEAEVTCPIKLCHIWSYFKNWKSEDMPATLYRVYIYIPCIVTFASKVPGGLLISKVFRPLENHKHPKLL